MGNLCDDLWVEILGRLSSAKDLVPCRSVSKLWRRITSDLWVRRFWAQSPPLGLFFRTTTAAYNGKYYFRMNYISLYNYHEMDDNLNSSRVFGGHFGDIESCPSKKHLWQPFDRQWSKQGRHPFEYTDRDEYLNGCNGLLLFLKSATYQFYVFNPITRQQVPIPKPSVHQNHDQHFCAALAFDPSESPHHYRVVRIDFSESTSNSSLLDIFSSEYGHWVRHRLQLDPGFIEGFEKFKLSRQFVYLRGKLYSIAISWKLLCIDLDTVEACALELPVPEADKTGAMGCLGVSMDLLCYIKRMQDRAENIHNLVVWYYDDESGEWVRRYSVSCRLLGIKLHYVGYAYDDRLEPYAISPSSDLLFFGTPNLICCYHLESRKIKFVFATLQVSKIDTPACFLTLRAFTREITSTFHCKSIISFYAILFY
ncbi:hypothetical protein M0R45_004301 [Rubus argutus]|uniref:F-box domain-containing protein n=1 Tax=Rubus argutus TaxID=59490 RepID=A0AAW1YJF7_RUBAR